MTIDKAGLKEAYEFIRDNPEKWRQESSLAWDLRAFDSQPVCFVNHYLRIKNEKLHGRYPANVLIKIAGINTSCAMSLYRGENTLWDIKEILDELGVFDMPVDKSDPPAKIFNVHDLADFYLYSHDMIIDNKVDLNDLSQAYEVAELWLANRK